VDSARRYGVKVGFYLSPADLHEAQPGGRFGNNSPSVRRTIPEAGPDGIRPPGPTFTVTANDYNRFYMNTLYELLSEYGQIDEVWWDGADAVGGSRESFDYPDWIRIVRTLQPQAVIFQDGGPDVRWVGNESGVARTDEHSVLPFNGSAAGAADRMTKPDDNGAGDLGSDSLLTQRNGNGSSRWDFVKWLPAECDTSLQGGWFWHAGDGPKSLDELKSIYYSSVGRNCVLLLNVPPDNRGQLTGPDVNRLDEFARWRGAVFNTDLARGSTAANGAGTSSTPGHDPAMAVDGDNGTAWQPESNTGSLTVDFGSARTLNVVELRENIGVGQRVTSLAVDAWNGTSWTTVTSATTVGYKRLLPLTSPVNTQRLRLRITAARARPTITTFAAYRDGPQDQPPDNLALGRPAWQSTTHDLGTNASRAVDGNTDGNLWNNSVTHTSDTRPDPAPWWQVDLGSSLPIGTVDVYNRTDCCAGRLSDYWIFTSDAPYDTRKTPAEQAATPGVWSSHEQTPAGAPTRVRVDANGRYVMVQQSGPTVLSLAEVEVIEERHRW
jgi:alpha-L-fucosidase